MKINLNNFKDVLKKSTLNFGIETLQLRFSDRIKCDSINSNKTEISILDLPNNVINTDDEITFNFIEPSYEVMPFLKTFDSEEVDIIIENSFMILKDDNDDYVSKIGFQSNRVISRLGETDVRNVEWFVEVEVNERIINYFDKIKKIGPRFGKVYLEVKDGSLFMDTSDKTNIYSSGVRFKLLDVEMQDLVISYEYSDMVNFFDCIEMDMDKEFKFKISYVEDDGVGCIYASSSNDEEKYALISRIY